MLINQKHGSSVEFISYTGKYPNLCSGILTLKINGEKFTFGYGKCDYDIFWQSGGSCGFNERCSINEWIIDYEKLPDKLKEYSTEIDYIFNQNVEHGCCGGCL